MLLNIAKHTKCCNLVKAKRMRNNEVISVLLRHAQRPSGKFQLWILSLELHEKTLDRQSYAYAFLRNEANILLLILLRSRNYKSIYNLRFFFLFCSYQKQISNTKTLEIHAACHTCNNLWTVLTTVYCISNVKKNVKKQKDLRLWWPQIVLSTNTFILLNRNFYLLAKFQR